MKVLKLFYTPTTQSSSTPTVPEVSTSASPEGSTPVPDASPSGFSPEGVPSSSKAYHASRPNGTFLGLSTLSTDHYSRNDLQTAMAVIQWLNALNNITDLLSWLWDDDSTLLWDDNTPIILD